MPLASAIAQGIGGRGNLVGAAQVKQQRALFLDHPLDLLPAQDCQGLRAAVGRLYHKPANLINANAMHGPDQDRRFCRHLWRKHKPGRRAIVHKPAQPGKPGSTRGRQIDSAAAMSGGKVLAWAQVEELTRRWSTPASLLS